MFSKSSKANPVARISVRRTFGHNKEGKSHLYNRGWYAELAVPMVYVGSSPGNHFLAAQALALDGYRGVVGKRFILEGSAGFGPKVSIDSNSFSYGKITPSVNVAFAYVLFSK